MDADRAVLAAALRKRADPYQQAITDADLGGTIADLARGAGASVLGLPGDVLDLLGFDPENQFGTKALTSESLGQTLFGMDDDDEAAAALLVGGVLAPTGKMKATKGWLAKILQRARKAGGGTIPLSGAPQPKRGYAVATTDRGVQTTFDPSETTPAKLQQFIREQQMSGKDNLGLWINKDDGKLYADKTDVHDSRYRALREGKANKQLALYDLGRKQEIETEFGRRQRALAQGQPATPAPAPAKQPPKMFDVAGPLSVLRPPKTVRGERTVRPGIYDNEARIVSDSARMVGPQNPLLRPIFGLDRVDFDALALQTQDPSIANPLVYLPPRGAPAHTRPVMVPSNARRLGNVLEIASEEPRLAGMTGWYVTDPFRDYLYRRYGPELGERVFREHMLYTSPMSAANPVDKEIAKGTFAQLLNSQGRLQEFFDTDLLPEGLGHLAHSTAHASGARNLMNTGGQRFWGNNPSPKVPNYYFSKVGENWFWPTGDAHFVRATGLPDTRPLMWSRDKKMYLPDDTSIGKTEFAPIGEWFTNKVAAPLGLMGNTGQPLLWGAMASRTGVDTKIGAPYVELLLDNAMKSGARQGISAKDALDNYLDIVAGLKKGDPRTAYLGAMLGGGIGVDALADPEAALAGE